MTETPSSQQTAAPPPSPARIPGALWALLFAAVIIGIAYAFVGLKPFRPRSEVPRLEKYAPAPAFRFTDQDGSPVSTESLKGKIWVVNFIFTRCPGPCPISTAHMGQLNQSLGHGNPDVALVSISVDPDYDTPAVLKAYGERAGAGPRWRFLNGPRDQVAEVMQKGFLQALGKDSAGQPMHSTRFVIVDAQGWIRGFEDGGSPEVAARLRKDIQALQSEGKP